MRILKTTLTVLLCAALLLSSFRAAHAAEPRETLLMNFGWKFHKGELPVNDWGKYASTGKYGREPGIGLAYDDRDWRAIDLPQDFVVESFDPDPKALTYFKAAGGSKGGVGWYRRHFTIPASDKGRRISVEFGGAFQTTTVYLNDFIVGRSESGYALWRRNGTQRGHRICQS